MSTSAQVEAAWASAIWQNATITAITDKVLTFPYTEESEVEVTNLYSGQEINAFEVLTNRIQRYGETAATIGGILHYQFEVDIRYYRAVEPTGANYTATRDTLETLFALVVSELGSTWGGTVDFWKPDTSLAEITRIKISTEDVWRGRYRFFADKQSDL